MIWEGEAESRRRSAASGQRRADSGKRTAASGRRQADGGEEIVRRELEQQHREREQSLRGEAERQAQTLRAQLEQTMRAEFEQGAQSREQALQTELQQTQAREHALRAELDEAKAREQSTRADLEQQAEARLQSQRAEWEQQADARERSLRAELEQSLRAEFERQGQEREQSLRAELDQQAQAREQTLRTELEQQQTAMQEGARGEIEQRIEQAVAVATRGAELERESDRRRAEAELERERARFQQELDTERARLREELDTERARAAELEAAHASLQTDTEALSHRLHGEIAAAREAAAAASAPGASAVDPAIAAAAFERASHGVCALDGTRSLSQALDTLLAHAATIAGRAALFLIEGEHFRPWKGVGIADADIRGIDTSVDGGDLLARAAQTGMLVRSSPHTPAPPFARLGPDRNATAMPIMIGGRAVAVLYADGGSTAEPDGAFETVDLLARHTSTVVALRTAMRTLDVLRGVSPDAPGGGDSLLDDQGARRFARLLISEIKLYNEAAVNAGRQQRDLRQRLRAEIDRARRLYEERVPPAIGARHAVFQQELVQTLADGDPALLGNA